MQGETNADWRIGEYMKNNILIVNEDEKEATELKNRLQSTTTNVFCCFTMQDAPTCFVKHNFCLIIKQYFSLKMTKEPNAFTHLTQKLVKISNCCLGFAWYSFEYAKIPSICTKKAEEKHDRTVQNAVRLRSCLVWVTRLELAASTTPTDWYIFF